jgi:hypothetical protein
MPSACAVLLPTAIGIAVGIAVSAGVPTPRAGVDGITSVAIDVGAGRATAGVTPVGRGTAMVIV